MADAVAIEVAGVPTWWLRGDRELTTLSLVFGGGRADETLATSGWLHLLEHYALHGSRPPHVHVNGSVDLLHTQFDFEGAPADVAREVRVVLGRLHSLDAGTLDHELRVLEAEGRERHVGPEAESMVWRYGARGPGLIAFPEWGLARADVHGLTALASRVFNRGNCALAVYGPLPDGIDLDPLPNGQPLAGEDTAPLPSTGPFAFASTHQAIGVTSLLERSEAAATFSDLLCRRVTEQFRHAAGLVYSPRQHYHRLRHQVISGVAIEVDEGSAGAVLEGLPRAMADLAEHGPSAQELAHYRTAASQRAFDPPVVLARAWENARRAALRLPPQTATANLFHYAALTQEDIRREAETAAASLILAVPGQTPVGDLPVPLLPEPEESTIWPQATMYRPRQGVLDGDSQQVRILLADGVLQDASSTARVTYPSDDIAAVLAWPDGARQLIRTDGCTVRIEPTQWRRGNELVAGIDAWVPSHLVLPRPARPAHALPSAPTLARRLRVFWRNWWEVVLSVGLVGLVALAWIVGRPSINPFMVLLVALAVLLNRALRKHT